MMFFNKLVKQDIHRLLKYHWKQIVGVSILIGFLLFLLNVFVGVASYTSSLRTTFSERLGIYFYIKESPETQATTYKRVMELQNDLHKQGLTTIFSSKDDAIGFLERKIPEITDSFSKFGIDNPLPSTLYVMFTSHKEYDALRNTILTYKDIVLNVSDIPESNTMQEQENRILNIINASNFIVILSIIITLFLGVIVFTFLGYQTIFIFQYFRKQIDIKNLLGGSYFDIIKEFIVINLSTLILGFLICLGLLILTWSAIGITLYELFSIGILDVFAQSHMQYILLGFVAEFLIFVLFSIIFSLVVLRSLKK